MLESPNFRKDKRMKKLLTLAAALAASMMAIAHDTGHRVVSFGPMMEQVAVPRQVGSVEQVSVGGGYDHAGRGDFVRTRTAPGPIIIVRTAPVPHHGVTYQRQDAPHRPAWSGHRGLPVVRYVSTVRRGNSWEDDFGDRQMR